MNTPFYIWSAIFAASLISLVLLLTNMIHMKRFYKMMNQHVKKETEKSDRRICAEIEVVEYTDAECGREK